MSILRKNKRDYFENLKNKVVTDNRKFWKNKSPIFSKKNFHREYITLKESNKTITNNEELAETFNILFREIVPNLNLDNNFEDNVTNSNIADTLFSTIKKYENYQSILKTKK